MMTASAEAIRAELRRLGHAEGATKASGASAPAVRRATRGG
jgi:hypothetical protein